MNKIIFLVYFFVFTVMSCKNLSCPGIQDGKYRGYSVAFYHKPVTGSIYELIIIPSCSDSVDLIVKFMNGHKFKDMTGVSVGMNSRNLIFKGILDNSTELKIVNNDSLAPEFRRIYACPIFIQFEGVENDTKFMTHLSDSLFSKTLTFQNGREILLQYFISYDIKITEFRVLR